MTRFPTRRAVPLLARVIAEAEAAGMIEAAVRAEMGLVAASRLPEIRNLAPFIASFGVLMPLVGAAVGGLFAFALGLSAGGIALLATLGGSASYIAVPAVMRHALPRANHGLSIAASLAVTFPFNVLVGIPLYIGAAAWLHGFSSGGLI